jgi:hypothetical protein
MEGIDIWLRWLASRIQLRGDHIYFFCCNVYTYGAILSHLISAFHGVAMLTTHCFRFTTILSAQLLNFWSIICVVIVSFIFLHVRYKIPQILGILLYSDHIKFVPGSSFANKLRLTAFQWNKRRRSP